MQYKHTYQVLSDPGSWQSWMWTGRSPWTSMDLWYPSPVPHTASSASLSYHSWNKWQNTSLWLVSVPDPLHVWRSDSKTTLGPVLVPDLPHVKVWFRDYTLTSFGTRSSTCEGLIPRLHFDQFWYQTLTCEGLVPRLHFDLRNQQMVIV